MTIVATEDNRNLEWRKNNVGSSLLQKMGWKEGQGIGRRTNSNTTALRALKRKDGLGLGAKIDSEGGSSERSNHFTAILQSLQTHHQPSTLSSDNKSTAKKKKKKKTKLTLAQNRVSAGHARKMREAKFATRSAEDMACIFGNKSLVTSRPEASRNTLIQGTTASLSSSAEKKNKTSSKKSKKKKSAV